MRYKMPAYAVWVLWLWFAYTFNVFEVSIGNLYVDRTLDSIIWLFTLAMFIQLMRDLFKLIDRLPIVMGIVLIGGGGGFFWACYNTQMFPLGTKILFPHLHASMIGGPHG